MWYDTSAKRALTSLLNTPIIFRTYLRRFGPLGFAWFDFREPRSSNTQYAALIASFSALFGVHY